MSTSYHIHTSLDDHQISLLPSNIQNKLNSVNESIEIRKRNSRSDFLQSLIAGQELQILKTWVLENKGWGQWENWLYANTLYVRIRLAQLDMELYRSWEPIIEELISETDLFADEEGYSKLEMFVNAFDDDSIMVARSTMLQLAKTDDVPQIAYEMAVKEVLDGNKLTSKRTKKLVEAAKAIDLLSTDEDKSIALELYHNHAVDNPQVLSRVPIIAQSEDLLQEVRSSGYITVPGIDHDKQQIAISEAGATDIDLAVGKESVEKEMTWIQENIPTPTLDQSQAYHYKRKITGTLAEIKNILDQENLSNSDILMIKLYVPE